MPNFREWTASEIIAQMPQARTVLMKHFGPEGVHSGSGFRLQDLANRNEVDVKAVVRDLKDMARSTGML
jgi:hypothetical protein